MLMDMQGARTKTKVEKVMQIFRLSPRNYTTNVLADSDAIKITDGCIALRRLWVV